MSLNVEHLYSQPLFSLCTTLSHFSNPSSSLGWSPSCSTTNLFPISCISTSILEKCYDTFKKDIMYFSCIVAKRPRTMDDSLRNHNPLRFRRRRGAWAKPPGWPTSRWRRRPRMRTRRTRRRTGGTALSHSLSQDLTGVGQRKVVEKRRLSNYDFDLGSRFRVAVLI